MRPISRHWRSGRCAIGGGTLLALSIGLSGCYGPEGGVPEAFCGYLYSCGNHGGSDNNNEAEGSSDSTASTGSSTGGEAASTPN